MPICLVLLAGPASAAGTTMPDFGPGSLYIYAVYGGYYLLVFVLLPALAVYVGYRLFKGSPLRGYLAGALRSRYVYSVAALIAWVTYVAIGTDGFEPRRIPGLRDWSIFVTLAVAAFMLPLVVLSWFRREKSWFNQIARIGTVAAVGLLGSSATYTAIEPQSHERARDLLRAVEASIYRFEATHGKTPTDLDNLPGNPRLAYLCRNIEFSEGERKLDLEVYVTENPSLMYRLSFGCIGRFSRGQTIVRAGLKLKPMGFVDSSN